MPTAPRRTVVLPQLEEAKSDMAARQSRANEVKAAAVVDAEVAATPKDGAGEGPGEAKGAAPAVEEETQEEQTARVYLAMKPSGSTHSPTQIGEPGAKPVACMEDEERASLLVEASSSDGMVAVRGCDCAPTGGTWRADLGMVVNSTWFGNCSTALVLLNMGLMCMPYYGMTEEYEAQLESAATVCGRPAGRLAWRPAGRSAGRTHG